MTKSLSISDTYEIPVKAAVLAGKKIMEIFGGRLGTAYKADDSPVTIADKAANTIIRETLQITGIPVVSEETELPEYQLRKSWQQYWLVDPLDGTKEFIDKRADFTVNIALIVNDRPEIGIILIPHSKELFLGNSSKMIAFKSVLKNLEWQGLDKMAWQLLNPLKPTDKLTVVASRSHLNEDTLKFIQALEKEYGPEMVALERRGSAVKFCLIAEGKAQVYPRFSPCMEWDTAAGQALCEAVGAVMMRMKDKSKLDYNKKDLLNPPFLLQAPLKNPSS